MEETLIWWNKQSFMCIIVGSAVDAESIWLWLVLLGDMSD